MKYFFELCIIINTCEVIIEISLTSPASEFQTQTGKIICFIGFDFLIIKTAGRKMGKGCILTPEYVA